MAAVLGMIERENRKGPPGAIKDPLYRLTRTDRTNPGATPPNQWTWNYDAVGNRTSAQKDSEATTSSYNEKNQLTGATGGGKMLWRGTLDEPGIATFSAPTINGQPARMLAGNVFEATLDLPAGSNNVTIQAQDGSGNIATKVYSVNVIGVPSSYTYDANGNLAAKTDGADSWTYSWNALNQLVTVTRNAVTVAAYSYDPVGRRVGRVADSTTTDWAYSREDILRESTTTASITSSRRFVHGRGIDEPIAAEDVGTGVITYFHGDAQASIARHTSASASVTRTITNDVWGNIDDGSISSYAFTGREWDPAARLHYYRARYYDPVLGRFVSQDPARYVDGMNLYQYVQGNPATFVDPSGLLGISESLCITMYTLSGGMMGAAAGGAAAAPGGVTIPIGAAAGGIYGAGAGFAAGSIICRIPSCLTREDTSSPSDADRCKAAETACNAKCADETLPTGTYNGDPFRVCRRKCLEAAGCWGTQF